MFIPRQGLSPVAVGCGFSPSASFFLNVDIFSPKLSSSQFTTGLCANRQMGFQMQTGLSVVGGSIPKVGPWSMGLGII